MMLNRTRSPLSNQHKRLQFAIFYRMTATRAFLSVILFVQFLHIIAENIVSIPAHYTYCLPPEFTSNASGGFVDTEIPRPDITNLLRSASKAPFIAYDPEFASILGPNPKLELLAGPFGLDVAIEAGVYVKGTNSVWFTGMGRGQRGQGHVVMAINLTNNAIYRPKYDHILLQPNGGTYDNGNVYMAYWGNETFAGGILAVNAVTGISERMLDSYFGLHLNGPNDIAWAQRGDRRVMFFTDNNFPYLLNYTGPNELPNAVWRFDNETESLMPVIGRADIPDPNGVAVNRESTKLYVTDTPVSYLREAGPGETTGSAAIYVFDLNEDLIPINKRLFGFSRARAPDGMKVDVLGRVWTAEGEGVVVRNEKGKVLGVFNSKALADDTPTISNFALVNNHLIILAETSIWSVALGQLVGQ